MNFPFWGLISYVWFFFFSPAEIYHFLAPLRLALVIPILTFISVLLLKKNKIFISSETILLIFFFFLCLISTLGSRYFDTAIEVFPHVYKTLFLFILIIIVIDDEKSIKRFIWIILIFILYDNMQAIYAYHNRLLGHRFASANLGGGIGSDPNSYSMHMLMVIPFTLLIIKYESSFFKKAFLAFSFLSYSYCFTRALSRGAMIAGVAVFLQLLIIQRKNFKFLILMLILLAVIVYFTPGSFLERFDTITGDEVEADHSIKGRLLAFEDGIALVKKNPFFGVGIGAFRDARADLGKFGGGDYIERLIAHNTYMEIAAESGVMSLFVFIILISTVLKGSLNSEKFFIEMKYLYLEVITQGLRIGLIAFLIASIFLSQQYSRFFYIFIALLTSLKFIKKRIIESKT